MNDPEQIIAELAAFYTDLYKTCDNYTDEELQRYMDNVALPSLSRQECMEMEATLTLDELK